MKTWQLAALVGGGLGALALISGGKKDKTKALNKPSEEVQKDQKAEQKAEKRDNYQNLSRLYDLVELLDVQEGEAIRQRGCNQQTGMLTSRWRQNWIHVLPELIESAVAIRDQKRRTDAGTAELQIIDGKVAFLRQNLEACAAQGSEEAQKALSRLNSYKNKPLMPETFLPAELRPAVQNAPANAPQNEEPQGSMIPGSWGG